MTLDGLIGKLGLAEVVKSVSISREEVLLQMVDAYLNNYLPQINDIIYRD